MKRVEFIEVESRLCGFGLGKGSKYEFNGITEIIKQKITDGWEYCGYVPIRTRGTGDIEKLSLIFQRNQD